MDGINIFVCGGGIFSHFHQFLENILRIDYKKYKKYRLIPVKANIKDECLFDNVFYYDDLDKFDTLDTVFPTQNSFLKINTFSRFNELKHIMSTFKFQEHISNSVSSFVLSNMIDENTLGVHLRLTDMNTHHTEYGVFTIQHFIEKTRMFLKEHAFVTKIFLASDNTESLLYFKTQFPTYTVIWIDESFRCEHGNSNNYAFQLSNLNNPDFIKQIFIEALVLSKCGYLIHRISDLANFAILTSDTFKKIVSI